MGPRTCTFRTRARSGPLGPQLTMRDSLGAFSFPEEEMGVLEVNGKNAKKKPLMMARTETARKPGHHAPTHSEEEGERPTSEAELRSVGKERRRPPSR